MNHQSIIKVGLIAIIIEIVLGVAQNHFAMPSWIGPVKWGLLLVAIICIVLYFVFKGKGK